MPPSQREVAAEGRRKESLRHMPPSQREVAAKGRRKASFTNRHKILQK